MGTGYMGKVLWVDLGNGSFTEQDIAPEVYVKFLSGYGLGAKLITDRQKPGADPLGPDNILGFMSGLLTGTGAMFSGRWMVVGKSPLTGGWGDANCGGRFAPAIKQAGYDGIFFVGKSSKPVYLLIDSERRELKEAVHLWGTDAIECEAALMEEYGNTARVACIGPGGENLSLMAGVVNDRGRISARSGLGAVMGSKNLKALCLNGKHKVEAHDRKKVVELSRAFTARLNKDKGRDRILTARLLRVFGRALRKFKTQPAQAGGTWKQTLRKWGTCGITAMSAESGDSPVQNWKGAGFEDFPISKKSRLISDDNVTRYEQKKYSCFSCPLGCGGLCEIKDGPNPPSGETHKPEYETLCAFGSMLLIDDLPRLYEINELLNRAGIDSISCGAVVGFAIEAFERGMLTEQDTEGIRLAWGDAEAVVLLTKKIIEAEGVGELLKDGVKCAAEKLGKGSEEFAMHAGGQELPMHDGRYDAGWGLSYEVEPTPGRHTVASYTYRDLMALNRYTKQMPKGKLLHKYKERIGTEGKGQPQSLVSCFTDLINGCGLCLFGVSIGGDLPVTEYLNAATGWNRTFDDYLEVGRRIKTLRQAFNVREGIKPSEVKMPRRARGEPPMDRGPLKGIAPDFDALKKDFYKAMGWDPQTGVPTDKTMEELGLSSPKAEKPA